MSQAKDQSKAGYKSVEHLSSGSESHHESEEDHFAPVVESKKQQKQDTVQKKIEKLQALIEVEYTRQVRRPQAIVNPKPKGKRRNKNKGAQGDNMIKKQQRKRSAAPPELVTSSSKSSSQKSQNHQKAAPQQPRQSPRLYIGNLPLSFTQSQIRKLFKKYGSLKEVTLMINSTTGKKSKGFGFVQFNEMGSAIKAKEELCSHILDGLKITIEFCENQ